MISAMVVSSAQTSGKPTKWKSACDGDGELSGMTPKRLRRLQAALKAAYDVGTPPRLMKTLKLGNYNEFRMLIMAFIRARAWYEKCIGNAQDGRIGKVRSATMTPASKSSFRAEDEMDGIERCPSYRPNSLKRKPGKMAQAARHAGLAAVAMTPVRRWSVYRSPPRELRRIAPTDWRQ